MDNLHDRATTKVSGQIIIRDPVTGHVFLHKNITQPKKLVEPPKPRDLEQD